MPASDYLKWIDYFRDDQESDAPAAMNPNDPKSVLKAFGL